MSIRTLVLAAISSVALAGCAQTSTAPATSAAATSSSTALINAQHVATAFATIVKNDVAIYLAANPSSPYTAQINSGVASLTAAVAVFNNLQGGASLQTEASSLLSVAQAVVNALPTGTLNANDVLVANTLISNLQLLLALLPAPAVVLPSTSSGSIVLVPL